MRRWNKRRGRAEKSRYWGGACGALLGGDGAENDLGQEEEKGGDEKANETVSFGDRPKSVAKLKLKPVRGDV